MSHSPIIICGHPRSATTFVQALLNRHDRIQISNEICTGQILPAVPRFVSATARDSWDGSERSSDEGNLLKTLWYQFSKGERRSLDENLRWGNKTPFNELFIPLFERAFVDTPPLYIHTIRDGNKVFESLFNMSWTNITFMDFVRRLEKFKSSYQKIEWAKKKFPDRVLIVQIDQLENSKEARSKFVAELFAFIGENVDPATQEFVDSWQIVNTKTDKPRKQLPLLQRLYLARDLEFQNIQRRYGYAYMKPKPYSKMMFVFFKSMLTAWSRRLGVKKVGQMLFSS